MGLFDKFKKKQEEVVVKPEIKKIEDDVEILSVECKGGIKHSNNEKTDLYIARMSRTENTIIFDMADYVAFEMPREKQLNEQIKSLIKRRYSRESKGIYPNNNKYYFGRLKEIGQDMYFGNKSNAVSSIVEKLVDEEIKNKNEQDAIKSEEYMKNLEKKQEEEMFRSRIMVEENLKQRDQERQKRKSNLQLKKMGTTYIDGKKHYDYSGINTNTGEILRVTDTSKIGKDDEGTYLYTAKIYNTENEYDAHLLGLGYQVCFELYKSLENIVQTNNPEEIQKVLELLSDKRNFEDIDSLKYIGALNKYGQISREKTSRSIPIAEKISKMQQEFEKNKEYKER